MFGHFITLCMKALTFSVGIEMEHWYEMGLGKTTKIKKM